MDFYQAVRLRALAAVLHPDRDYLIRRTIRWFSKTFHTPVAVVEELPLEEIVSTYYEEQYAQMTPEQQQQEREDLLLSDEDRQAQVLAEEAEEAEMYEMSRLVVAEEEAKKRGKKPGGLGDVKTPAIPLIKPELPESDLPKPKLLAQLPEGISMTFVDEKEFEKEVDGFGLMTPPGKS